MRLPERLTSALRITLVYLAFGGLWILLSDWLLSGLTDTAAGYRQWQTVKGWAFVAASGGVIYLLVRRELRRRRRGEELFAEVLDLVPDPVVVRRTADRAYVAVNSAFERLVDRPSEEVEGRTPEELGLRLDPDEWSEYARRLEEDGQVSNYPLHVRFPEGKRRTLLLSGQRRTYEDEEFLFAAAKDVTALEAARDRFEAQVQRIQALRDIDMAITASRDVRVTLNVVLDQVTAQLGVDAATVLLVNEPTHRLEYAAGRGFRTQALRHTRLEFGEGYAGRAARQGDLVWVDDLRKEPDALARSKDLGDEGFVTYAATALSAKGRVNGVLEIFHREPLDPPQDWFDFLDALAGQASIAIDNAELYQDLQRSHEELRAAYDETIEGWARALDLRDRETHGHTQRVARVTVRLAREMGVPEDELAHVRRGALLHDIGKMGIPDSILLKPGPLDGEEWTTMEKHPELAYRLLSPVEFLRPALDIPQYHHERWDGSGYPGGLEGDGIPLTARIFAVVDVWDALLSDRPYRDAWDEEAVYEHLREEAGSHFDPEVVEAFLGLDLEEIPIPERRGPEEVPGLQRDLFDTSEEDESS